MVAYTRAGGGYSDIFLDKTRPPDALWLDVVDALLFLIKVFVRTPPSSYSQAALSIIDSLISSFASWVIVQCSWLHIIHIGT